MSTFSPSLTVRHLGTQNYHTIRAGCMASAHSNVLTNHSHRRTITRRIVVIDTHRRCRHRFSTFLIGNHACIFGHIYSTPSNDLELSHGRSLSHGFSLQQRNQMNASSHRHTPIHITRRSQTVVAWAWRAKVTLRPCSRSRIGCVLPRPTFNSCVSGYSRTCRVQLVSGCASVDGFRRHGQ